MHAQKVEVTRGGLARVLDAVRERRFPCVRRTQNPLVSVLGARSKRFWCELKVNEGNYCVMQCFKDEDSKETGSREEFRFVGSRVEAEVLTSWPSDISPPPGNSKSGRNTDLYKACVVVRGPDLKKQSGGSFGGGGSSSSNNSSMVNFSGELFIFAENSIAVSQIRNAVLGLAKASLPPVGECRFPKAKATDVDPSREEKTSILRKTFVLPQETKLQIARACTRIEMLSNVPPGMLWQLQPSATTSSDTADDAPFTATKVSADEERRAFQELQEPPNLHDEDANQTPQSAAMWVWVLTELLRRLKSRPIGTSAFRSFCARADKCVQSAEEGGVGDRVEQPDESEAFADIVVELLTEIHAPDAVLLIKDVTRALKHLLELRAVSVFECAEVFGPLLVKDFDASAWSNQLGLFFTATTSAKNRDRIFSQVAALVATAGSKRRLVGSSSAGADVRTPSSSVSSSLDAVAAATAAVASAVASSPLTKKRMDVEPNHETRDFSLPEGDEPEPEPSPAATAEVGATSASGMALSFPASTSPSPSPSLSPTTTTTTIMEPSKSFSQEFSTPQKQQQQHPSPAEVDTDDFFDMQEEIASLTRLFEYLRTRLRDEPNAPNAGLWRKELEACQAELAALGPTMLVVATDPSAATESSETSAHAASNGGSNNISSSGSTNENNGSAGEDFVERALALWAEARKEPLHGPKQQVDESGIVLKHALSDVRALIDNVSEFPELRDDKTKRQTACALVNVLEENVQLRLRLLGRPDVLSSSSLSPSTANPGLRAKTGSGTPITSNRRSSSSAGGWFVGLVTPNRSTDNIVSVAGDDEYEI